MAEFSFEETCMSQYTYFTDESVADSSKIINYLWDFGDMYNSNTTSEEQNPVYVFDSTGNYITLLSITDENTCIDTITHELEIYPVPTSGFMVIDTVQQGQIYLQNLSEGANSYFWDFDNGFNSTEANPMHLYEYDGDYRIMQISYNDFGCPDTSQYNYEVLYTNLFVPNAFVPGSDNQELQFFKPVGINLSSYKLEVYSAWGNLVFESTRIENGSPSESWDGSYNGEDLPTGSFMWRISAVFKDGSIWKGSDNGDGNSATSGTVTLIR